MIVVTGESITITQKSGGGGLSKNWGVLSPLAPSIAGAATGYEGLVNSNV